MVIFIGLFSENLIEKLADVSGLAVSGLAKLRNQQIIG
jgi:hypothetical protein